MIGSVEELHPSVSLQCRVHFSSKIKRVKVRFFRAEIQVFDPKYVNLSKIGMFLELIVFLPKITGKNGEKTCVFWNQKRHF